MVNISAWRAAIEGGGGRRRREEVFEEWDTEGHENDTKKTCVQALNVFLFLVLTFSATSCITSSLFGYTYFDMARFPPATCSTDTSPLLTSSSTSGDFSRLQRMTLAVEELVRMLLVVAGLETNPGPVSRMFLLSEPLTTDPRPPVRIHCEDGSFYGDFFIISSYSKTFAQLVGSNASDCKECAPVVHLPDFSTSTMAHLFELLTSGETLVTRGEKKKVIQLQV
jgi:hypothetical protein